MTRLSSQKVLQENRSSDSASITALTLPQRALSDVSCLKEFRNLEKLDLSFNNLSSLEGLSSCINLKWLSVVQNKLESLRGIETLLKLTVLNAGKNKLKSMDEVRSIVSLRALILNDNEITSISGVDQLKELNTLVVSRNPICDIGDSLVKLKSITKLSLSNCQLQTIGASLRSLVNMKELRLSHNEITTLPAELAKNIKLLTVDLGNNFIRRHSDLKVLSSLHNLRNLNLQGNPVAEKDKLAEKIRSLVPDLQIFNNKPTERGKKYGGSKKDIENHIKISGKRSYIQDEDNPFDSTRALDVEKKLKQKKSKTSKVSEKDVLSGSRDDTVVNKELNGRKEKEKESKLDPIDDGEIPFMELISDRVERLEDDNEKKKIHDIKSLDGIVTFPAKRKKASKNLGLGSSALQLLSSETEVGMGGPSAWDA